MLLFFNTIKNCEFGSLVSEIELILNKDGGGGHDLRVDTKSGDFACCVYGYQVAWHPGDQNERAERDVGFLERLENGRQEQAKIFNGGLGRVGSKCGGHELSPFHSIARVLQKGDRVDKNAYDKLWSCSR